MKSTGGILNGQLSRIIAETGHRDMLVVTDAGLPIPSGVERVDLAVTPMIPRFIEVLKAVKGELAVEGIVLAEEIKACNSELESKILDMFPGIPVTYVPHKDFKEKVKGARACVRSAEFSPYANILIIAGCCF